MLFAKRIFCKHEWIHHGWSYIKCTKCERTKLDEEKNEELMGKWLKKRRETTGESKEEINKFLSKKFRTI